MGSDRPGEGLGHGTRGPRAGHGGPLRRRVCQRGGDIQLLGGPWRIGLADPLQPGALAAVVEVWAPMFPTRPWRRPARRNAAAASSTRTRENRPGTRRRR